MWDKILTDDDGPYIELMVGAYSDNQPDYSWLQPYETKSFSMYWYPFRDIGGVKKANLDAAVNLEVAERHGQGRASAPPRRMRRRPSRSRPARRILLEETMAISPGKPYVKQIACRRVWTRTICAPRCPSTAGSWSPMRPSAAARSAHAQGVSSPAAPKEIKTVEELYLTGLRIEQFHDPALEPEPYWEEALRRDPGDARVNTALGIPPQARRKFAEAERVLPQGAGAAHRPVHRAQRRRGDLLSRPGAEGPGPVDEAFDAFYKATWSAAWRPPATLRLAEIAASRGEFTAALGYVDRSLEANALSIRALNLKAALLRHLGAPRRRSVLASAARKIDPLDVRVHGRTLAGLRGTGDGEALAPR